MAQTLYVLTTLIEETSPSEWRPVGIVSSEETANQWAAHGGNNDWISFIVDDLSLTGLSGEKSQFESKPPTPDEEKIRDIANKLMDTNARLLKINEALEEKLKGRKKRTSSLWKKKE
jgi:hypothetical protein